MRRIFLAGIVFGGLLLMAGAADARKSPGLHFTRSYTRRDGTHVSSYHSGHGATLSGSRGSRSLGGGSSSSGSSFSGSSFGGGSGPDADTSGGQFTSSRDDSGNLIDSRGNILLTREESRQGRSPDQVSDVGTSQTAPLADVSSSTVGAGETALPATGGNPWAMALCGASIALCGLALRRRIA